MKPRIKIPNRIDAPQTDEQTSANGVKIYTLPTDGYDVVRVSFTFRAGSSWQTVPLSASAVANCLSEGSKNFTAQQIAEQLDFYGSFYDVSIDRDWATVTFVALTRHFETTMKLAEEILLHPTFPDSELASWCDKSRANLVLNRRKGDFLAREHFLAALYGDEHPYGRYYPETAYNDLTHNDLAELYARLYTASNCFVVASGAITPEVHRRIETITEQLPAGTPPAERQFPPLPVATELTIPMTGAVQASLRIGRVLFGRTHPDFTAMQLLLTVLGGYFGSRLMHTLREERGYTYGVYATMVNFDTTGHLAISTEVGGEVSDDATALIFNELQRLQNDPIPESELSAARRMVLGETMRILDGPFGIADITIENVQCGTTNAYLTRFLDEIRTTTPAHLLSLAQRYLTNMTTVIVK